MRRNLPIVTLLLILVIFLFISRPHVENAKAATADHVVISEIQVGGTTSTDEFVELYNPTADSVSLANWTLYKKTASGSAELVIATLSGTLTPRGYFLIGHENYDGTPSADAIYPATGEDVAANNTVILRNALSALIDKVGMGGAADRETDTTNTPGTNKSVERKANTSSNQETMGVGAADEFAGNGEDSDNNMLDFYLRNTSQPQGTTSSLEPVGTVTPAITSTPTLTPTEGPTSTPTSTPTGEPTETLTPTMTPTGEPTSTPTDTPTETVTPTTTVAPTEVVTPTESPTEIPTVTVEPTETVTPTLPSTPTSTPTDITTPTATPTVTLTPTGVPSQIIAAFPFGSNSVRVCSLQYRLFGFGFTKVWFPTISCKTIPIPF